MSLGDSKPGQDEVLTHFQGDSPQGTGDFMALVLTDSLLCHQGLRAHVFHEAFVLQPIALLIPQSSFGFYPCPIFFVAYSKLNGWVDGSLYPDPVGS